MLPRTSTGRPRVRTTDDVLSYWAERIEQVAPRSEWFRHSSMICEGDSLFHYGHHFELSRIMRDKRGRTRLVLLNGDTWSGTGGFGPSTSSRQSDTRREVACHSAPSVVIPFSALDGAGIDYTSVRPIHVRADRETYEEHSSRKQPTRDLATMPDPSGRMTTETRWNYSTSPPTRSEVEVPVRVPDPNRTLGFRHGHGTAWEGAQRGEDGIWRWQVRRHWLGDSIFRARLTETRTRPATPEEREATERRRVWEVERDRLSNLLAYFPESWERADALSWRRGPDRYRFERRRHRENPYDYRRMLRLEMAREGFHQQLIAHYAVEPPATQVRNGRVAYRVTRWATYLSSFDYQERTPLYFLCELPYGAKPNTVDEAIEALKPPEVVAALARGLDVIRQGDLFAIPTQLTKRQLRRMRGRNDFEKRLRVLGTNHAVTEGIVLKGGAVLGRGVMRHEPEFGRAPDHAQVNLGNAWHMLVRNTVPRTH